MSDKLITAVNDLLRKIRDEEQMLINDRNDRVYAVPIHLIQPEIDEVARLFGDMKRNQIQELLDESQRSKIRKEGIERAGR